MPESTATPVARRGSAPAIAAGCGAFLLELVFAAMQDSPLHPLLPADAGSVLSWSPSAIGLDGVPQGARVGLVVVAVAVALGLFLYAAREAWRGNVSVRAAVIVAAVFALGVLLVPLLLSRDVYNYALYGRFVSLRGLNPYTTVPNDVGAVDPFYALSGEKWRDIPTVYGPAFTALSAAVTGLFKQVGSAVMAFRVIASLAAIGTSVLIAFSALRLVPKRAAFAVVVFGWSPVVVFNGVGGGHNDLLIALAIAGGLALAVADREVLATVVLTLGVLVKASAAVPLILFIVWALARRDSGRDRMWTAVKLLAIAGVMAVAFAVPFWQTQNPTLGLAEVSTHEGGYSVVTLLFYTLARGAGALFGSGAQSLVTVLLRLTVLVVFIGVLVMLARRVWRDAPGGMSIRELGASWGWGLLVVMLLSPFILPWYIVWILPLAALLARFPMQVAIALSCVFALFQTVAEPLRSSGMYRAITWGRDWLIRPAVGVLLVLLLLDLWRRLRSGASLSGEEEDDVPDTPGDEQGEPAPAPAV